MIVGTEAIAAKWDAYLDSCYPDGEASSTRATNANNATHRRRRPHKREASNVVLAERREAKVTTAQIIESANNAIRELKAERRAARKPHTKHETYTYCGGVIARYNDGREVKYASVRRAAQEFGVTLSNIYNAMNGKAGSVKGATLSRIETKVRGGSTPVIAIYPDGRKVWYASIRQAARACNIGYPLIRRCVLGIQTTTHGIKWARAQ